jgi:hypothetical protein
MTKYLSPEITGTELIGTDYIRVIGDERCHMRERPRHSGKFFGIRRLSTKEVLEADTGPVMGDMVSPDDIKESPKRVSLKYVQSELEKHFDKEPPEDAEDDTGRYSAYVRPVFVVPPKEDSEPRCIDTFSLWVGSESIDFSLPAGLPINYWRVSNTEDWVVAVLAALLRLGVFVDESQFGINEAEASRARQEQYRIDHPENDSEIFRCKPRNASPTREKDVSRLNAWAECSIGFSYRASDTTTRTISKTEVLFIYKGTIQEISFLKAGAVSETHAVLADMKDSQHLFLDCKSLKFRSDNKMAEVIRRLQKLDN